MISYLTKLTAEGGGFMRIIIIAAVVVAVHLAVIRVGRLSYKLMSSRISSNLSKSRTITKGGPK